MEEIHYDLSFEETVRLAVSEIDDWFAGPQSKLPEIDKFPEPIYFKSSTSMIVHANAAYHKFFARGVTAVGRLASSFLDNSVLPISQHSDALILGGADYVEFDHHCLGCDNYWYRVRTYKKGLLKYHSGAFDILGISRPINRESSLDPTAEFKDQLQVKYEIFKMMDGSERQICNLIAEGRSTEEIAKFLHVTSAEVEKRRRNILRNLQFDKVIDIVKMMVRFEERDFEI